MNILKSGLIYIKTIIFFFFDSTAYLKNTISKKTTLKTVLLIRQDSIGDFIIWLDTAKEYRKLFPSEKYKIVLIGNSLWLSLANSLPYWDTVIAIDSNKFKTISLYRWNMLNKIRSIGAEIAIQPTFSREFFHGDSLIRASRALQKVSSEGDLSNLNKFKKLLADKWHTKLIPASKEHLNEFERNTEFFSQLSGKRHFPIYPKLDLTEYHSSKEPPDSIFYIIGPGTSSLLKDWSTNNFAKITEKIYLNTGWNGLICGSTKDYILGEQIIKKSNAPLKNLAGKTNLHELSLLLRQSKLTVCNDTGTAHISSAVNTPTLCILGGGHFGRFLPYPNLKDDNKYLEVIFHEMDCFYCNWECIYPINDGDPAPCIANISVDDVWSKVNTLLQKEISSNLLPNNSP